MHLIKTKNFLWYTSSCGLFFTFLWIIYHTWYFFIYYCCVYIFYSKKRKLKVTICSVSIPEKISSHNQFCFPSKGKSWEIRGPASAAMQLCSATVSWAPLGWANFHLLCIGIFYVGLTEKDWKFGFSFE